MSEKVRIGTRSSKLAIYQAELVRYKLQYLGLQGELVFINSMGDLELDQAVQQLGDTGVFTKALDRALLDNEIDIAVHSYKDIPTAVHPDLEISSVLKRGDVWDAIIYKGNLSFLDDHDYHATIATGSPRRKALWLNKFPTHRIVGIRGNVNSRLSKFEESNWDGTIMALAGLVRLEINHVKFTRLDWMLPAPAQGAIAVMKLKNNRKYQDFYNKINDFDARLITSIERDFLREIEGGCTAPIAAMAKISKNKVFLKTAVLSPDGKEKIEVRLDALMELSGDLGIRAAEIARSEGVDRLVQMKE